MATSHSRAAPPRWSLSAAAACLGLALTPLGCSHSRQAPSWPATRSAQPAPSAPRAAVPSGELSDVRISENVRARCNLPDEPRTSPQFDFDEAYLRDRGKRILDGVAGCMVDGALKGEGLTIIGHADPRGSDAYNEALGMRRAESARDYLMSAGVPMSRLTVDSRGELDAVGSDEASWQLDRNVEITEPQQSAG